MPVKGNNKTAIIVKPTALNMKTTDVLVKAIKKPATAGAIILTDCHIEAFIATALVKDFSFTSSG